ncbi:MAG: hypothetical protein ACM3U2_17375 [Deltaproteobacteria bacterium]
MSDKKCPMCGAISNSTAACPACGEMSPKPAPGIKRLFLGLPIFETLFVIVFAASFIGALLVPVVLWIRSILEP